jgi:putative thioredoxin
MKPPAKPPASPHVKDVTEANFETEVLEASEKTPVVVDFWSPSCAPCRTLGPMLERLVNERKGAVILAKVNTDDAPRLAAYFGISAIPAVKAIYQRQLVNEFEGLLPEPALREFLDQIAQAGDPELFNAQAAELAAPARAQKLYREMIAKDPDKMEARVGLARVLLQQGQIDEIPSILEPVGPSGDVGTAAEGILAQVNLVRNAKGLPTETALRQQIAADPKNAQAHLDLGSLLASRGDYENALAELFKAAELDVKLASGGAREVMVKIFYALGSNHPLSNEYRSKLSRLLY